MKKIVVLFLALALLLTACAAPAPTVEPLTGTDEPAEMATESVPTEAPAPEITPTSAEVVKTDGPFTDILRSSDSFSFKCAPTEIIFSVRSLDPVVTSVLFFYRVIAKDSGMAAGAMVDSKTMVGDDKGHFTLSFKATDLKEDLRFANGWFEYQFVGLNKGKGIVARSEKVVKQVTFTLACP